MDLHSEVLKGFNLRASNIKKVKGMYICNTNNGAKIIKLTNQPISKIEDSQKIANLLNKNGINTFDKYDISYRNTPYFIFKDDVYICSDYIQSEKNDFANENSFLQAVSMLAMFHKATIKTDIERTICCSENILYEKNLHKLKDIKKRIAKQNKFSNFDISFIKNYENYLGDIEKSLEIMSMDYFKSQSDFATKNKSLVHNIIKEENFVMQKNKVYINNFFEVKNNVQILDLGDLIRRHIKMSPTETVDFHKVIDTYNNVKPINKNDVDIIKASVLYPKKFVKTVLSYYTKNRTWTPTGLENKLEAELSKRNIYLDFIS